MRKGLTLFEVLISIAIFSIIATGLGYAVVAGKSALLVSDMSTQLRQNLLFALMPMIRELRQTAPAQLNIGEGASTSALTFELPYDIDGDNIVVDDNGILEWGGPQITYALNGLGQLTRTCLGVTKVIAPNIAVLQFSRPVGKDSDLQIDLVVRKTDNQGRLYQDSEQFLLKMRN